MSASIPVAGTQNGSMLSDRNDAGLSWYLPAFTPIDPSDAFAFAASESSVVGPTGDPFDTATMTVAVAPVEPPDVLAARQANPASRYQAVEAILYDAALVLPYKDAQGTEQTARVTGQVAVAPDGSLLVTFAGLLGSTVIQAYEELADVGGASVEIGVTYSLWHHLTIPERRLTPPLLRTPAQRLAGGSGEVEALPVELLAPLIRVAPVLTIPPILIPIQTQPVMPIILLPIHEGPALQITPLPLPSLGMWIVVNARAIASTELGAVYAGASYRRKYTITPRSGATRPIIDVTDLEHFDAARSEFRELTSLGDVKTRYPSFDRLYLGQVSGTVMVIPAVYGIVHGSGGCAARIDAVVDTSSTSLSGCRFQLTFELGPVLDPVDVAQLAEDLKTVPEATRLVLAPTVPAAIDRRVTPTFSAPIANLLYADASDGNGLLLSFEVTDTGSTPALVNVNLLLAQLTSASTTPLFGTIGVRLDDVYTPPVQATVAINLHTTCATDDVAVTMGDPPVVTNQSPNDVRLIRMRASASGQQVTVDMLDDVLPAGHQADLTIADSQNVTSLVVQRRLELPNPFPRSALGHYLDIHAETVQQAMHALSVNATAVDFGVEGIAELDIQITLDALPRTAIAPFTLDAGHRVDGAHVVVPIDAALTGLPATLTISVHTVGAANDRRLELSNDFAANPIFVLVPAALAAAGQPSVPTQ